MEPLTLREEYEPGDGPRVVGRNIIIRIATIGRLYKPQLQPDGTMIRERIPDVSAFKEPLARPRGVLRFRHKGEHPGEPDDIDNFHGVMTGMAAHDGAVYADFEVFPGEREDKILKLIGAGAVTGASMAATVRDSRIVHDASGPIKEILRIPLVSGVSITPSPGYDDAGVIAVRESTPAAAKARLDAIAKERQALDSAKSAAQIALH
jgi:hypothetical protein